MRVPARCCFHQIGHVLDWLGEHDHRTAARLTNAAPVIVKRFRLRVISDLL
jgi:hypothetical protein